MNSRFLLFSVRNLGITIAIAIYLAVGMTFLLLQTYLDIYYFAVGGINSLTLFLAVFSFILIQKNVSSLQQLLRIHLLPLIIHLTLLVSLSVPLLFFKKMWLDYWPEKSTPAFAVFLSVAVFFLYPLYVLTHNITKRLFLQCPSATTVTLSSFCNALEKANNRRRLRLLFWDWLESYLPVASLVFFDFYPELPDLSPTPTAYGKKLTAFAPVPRSTARPPKLTPSPVTAQSYASRLKKNYDLVCCGQEGLEECIAVNSLETTGFSRSDRKRLQILTTIYRFFHLNLFYQEQSAQNKKLAALQRVNQKHLNNLRALRQNFQELTIVAKHAVKVPSADHREVLKQRLAQIIQKNESVWQ